MALICLRILRLNKIKLVKFHCVDSCKGPKERKKLKLFLENLFKLEKRNLDHISYIFCDDEYLLSINRRFLNHNYYTDIITFNLSGVEAQIIGEVYISSERVLENSAFLDVDFNEELLRVIFHGALHLSGYSDNTKAQTRLMRKAEDKYLKVYKKLVSRET